MRDKMSQLKLHIFKNKGWNVSNKNKITKIIYLKN